MAFKGPKRANSKCQSCSPVSEGEMDVTQGSRGEEIPARLSALLPLPRSQASSIKRLWTGFPECTRGRRAGFCQTNLWRCNPEC